MPHLLPLLIEPAELVDYLDNPRLRIVDLTSPESYAQGHIPGSVFVPPVMLQRGEAPAVGRLPTEAQLQQLLQALALSPEQHVVVYDNEGGGWAGRLIWILDVLGHPGGVSYLNGGMVAWRDEELPQSQSEPKVDVVAYPIQIDPRPSLDAEQIMARLGADDFAVWDARSAQEHRGEKVLAQRGGRIPGAAHCEWTSLMDPSRGLRLQNLDAIRHRLKTLGLTPEKEIVTHCQTHHRSGFTYLVAKILGYERIRAYPGSWSDWGNRSDTPVESEV